MLAPEVGARVGPLERLDPGQVDPGGDLAEIVVVVEFLVVRLGRAAEEADAGGLAERGAGQAVHVLPERGGKEALDRRAFVHVKHRRLARGRGEVHTPPAGDGIAKHNVDCGQVEFREHRLDLPEELRLVAGRVERMPVDQRHGDPRRLVGGAQRAVLGRDQLDLEAFPGDHEDGVFQQEEGRVAP